MSLIPHRTVSWQATLRRESDDDLAIRINELATKATQLLQFLVSTLATRTRCARSTGYYDVKCKSVLVSELCHIPSETWGNTVIYGDTTTHIDVA